MAARRLCEVIRTRVPWLSASRPQANWTPIGRRATLSSAYTVLSPRTQLQSNEHTAKESSHNSRGLLGLYSLVGLFGLFSQKDDSDAVPVSVKSAILTAQGHQNAGDYIRAEADYHSALQQLMDSPHAATRPFLEARAVVLDKLANMYLEMGKLDKALANFKETMKLMLACEVPEKSTPMVEISLKISKIYSNQNQLSMAAAGFQWCVDTATEIVANSKDKTNDLALLGMCLTDKGQFHLIEGNGKAAMECFMKGYGISVFIHGIKGVQTAVMSSNCATALDLMGFHEEACQLLESVITASQEHCKSEPEHMATLYTNLGTIRANQGDLEGARTAYEKGLEYAARMEDKNLYEYLQHLIHELNDNKN